LLTVSQNISIEEVIRAIVLQAGLSREDIMKKITDTITTFNGLLTPVGAALIIADKLNVKVNMNVIDPGSQSEAASTDSIKIKDLIDGMKNIVVFGRVTTIFPPKTFQRQDGRKGTVGSMLLRDATGTARVSMWDQKAGLLESSIKEGDVIGIYNASTKMGITGKIDINVDARATVKPKPDEIDASQFPEGAPASVATSQHIKDIKETANFCNFTAKVLEKEPVKEFQKKDGTSGTLGKVKVGDESATASILFWTDRMDVYETITVDDVYDFEGLGVKKSKFSNALEFNVNKITKIKKSIKSLDVKASEEMEASRFQGGTPGTVSTSQSIKEIKETANFCNFTAKVIEKEPVKEFQKKDGASGTLGKAKVGDETATATILFWTDRMDDFESLTVGDVYDFEGLGVKKNKFSNALEFSINRISKINKSEKNIDASDASLVDTSVSQALIDNFKDVPQSAFSINVKGKIALKFDVKAFNKNGKEGKVARIKLVDNDQQAITVVFWTERIGDFETLNVGDVIELRDVSSKLNRDQVELSIKATTTITPIGQETVELIDLKIGNMKDNQAAISFEGRVKAIEEERQVTLKDGTQVSLIDFIVGDETGSVNVVAWRDMVDVVKKLDVGDAIKIENVNIKFNKFRNGLEARMVPATKLTQLEDSTLPVIGELPQDQVVPRASSGASLRSSSPVMINKIGEIKDNQVNVAFEGRIKSIENEREVTLKDGTQTRNINFMVGDETGSINVVAWRDMVDVVKKFERGTAVKIENVNVGFSNFRNMMEAKMGKFSRINEVEESSVPSLDELPQEQLQQNRMGMSKGGPVSRISLDKIEANIRGEVLGQITNISKFVNHYLACPKCNKKVAEQNGMYTCVNDGKVQKPIPRLITRITVDDGSGNISVSMIGDNVVELFGISEQEKEKLAKDQDVENIMEGVSNRILLRPYRFQGRVKYNEFRNEYEIMADKVLEPEMGSEIKALVSKIESTS